MKRLFEVNGVFFENKQEAKASKDAVTNKVHLGPDHWRYGLKGNPRTHSHNCRSGGPGNGFPRRVR